MKKVVGLAVLLILFSGFKVELYPTMLLSPDNPESETFEIIPTGWHDLAVSRGKHSSVSVFGIAYRHYVIFWLHYQNHSDTAVHMEPWNISVFARRGRGGDKRLKCLCGHDHIVKGLESDLIGVYAYLRGKGKRPALEARLKQLQEAWKKKYHDEFHSLEEAMMKGQMLQAGGRVEGYVIASRGGLARKFILQIPFAGDSHEFVFTPKRPDPRSYLQRILALRHRFKLFDFKWPHMNWKLGTSKPSKPKT